MVLKAPIQIYVASVHPPVTENWPRLRAPCTPLAEFFLLIYQGGSNGFDGLTIAAKGSAFSYDYNGDGSTIYADFMTSPLVATVGGYATFQIAAGGCTFVNEIYIEPTESDPCAEGGC